MLLYSFTSSAELLSVLLIESEYLLSIPVIGGLVKYADIQPHYAKSQQQLIPYYKQLFLVNKDFSSSQKPFIKTFTKNISAINAMERYLLTTNNSFDSHVFNNELKKLNVDEDRIICLQKNRQILHEIHKMRVDNFKALLEIKGYRYNGDLVYGTLARKGLFDLTFLNPTTPVDTFAKIYNGVGDRTFFESEATKEFFTALQNGKIQYLNETEKGRDKESGDPSIVRIEKTSEGQRYVSHSRLSELLTAIALHKKGVLAIDQLVQIKNENADLVYEDGTRISVKSISLRPEKLTHAVSYINKNLDSCEDIKSHFCAYFLLQKDTSIFASLSKENTLSPKIHEYDILTLDLSSAYFLFKPAFTSIEEFVDFSVEKIKEKFTNINYEKRQIYITILDEKIINKRII